MKPFRWKILVCVVPVLLAALVVARAWYQFEQGRGGFKPGVDLAGGTILVYEVAQKPEGFNINDLVAALKRRIDPADLYNVTIRPVGTDRVEIIFPTGSRRQVAREEAEWQEFLRKVAERWKPESAAGYQDIPRGRIDELVTRIRQEHPDAEAKEIEQFISKNYRAGERRELTSEQVEQIKELISRQGSLEFRILANERDDAAAIQAARDYFARAKTDKAIQNELELLALEGKPPPPPRNAQGGNTFAARDGTIYGYSWVELGPDERHNLKLNNAAENDPTHNTLWQMAAKAREAGEPLIVPRPWMRDVLLYSRPYIRVNPPAKDKDKKYEYFFLTREPERGKAVTGDYLVYAGSDVDEKLQPIVKFRFNSQGGELFYELTSKNRPEGDHERHLAIIMDGQIVSAPVIRQPIHTEGQITGIASRQEVDTLVAILRSGRLPATLKPRPVSENTIGATLGEDTIKAGTTAVGLAFVGVLAFMLVYYRFAGLVASIALLANLVLTVAFMVLVNATFTLPGLAGLVLMLGMAVDANVLIYERVREERDRGASLALAIRNGYDRAFPTIIDTHLTSIFTAIVLYIVGNDQLKGFGISLTVGLIISLFTALYMTRVYFDLALANGWLTKLSMMRLLTRPNINFMAVRHYAFAFTATVSILGVALFLFRGEQGLNIDFVGGTAYTGQLSRMMNIQELRTQIEHGLKEGRLQVKDVQQLGDPYTYRITYADDKDYVVRLPNPTTAEDVRQRAGHPPEYSLEMIYLQSEEFTVGDRSRMFTFRTTERAPELVQLMVSRLLGDDLRQVRLDYQVKDADAQQARTAVLKFSEKPNEQAEVKEAYASPARVAALLGSELQSAGLGEVAKQVVVRGVGTEEEGLFHQMEVTLPEPVDRARFEGVLTRLQQRFMEIPQPERLENFDSQLARETQLRALYAILASWGAILLYLWFRFGNWTFGLAAVLCLIHDLCFTLGAIAACHYLDRYVPWLAQLLLIQDFKLDLAAIASLLTLVGFSVNDTIVVFDRIREVRGKNPALTPQMINDSINQTLSRTLLTTFTVWLVVFVLYVWGGSGVHLFAFVMVVGAIVGTFSSIYVASPLLLLLGEGRLPTAARERPAQPTPA
ncbi:MAG TPA: protein translocase subunit SecD [Gemmataceae bacterium]|nr:protein translocase subunit SecD [Gemmataceae bacterium]